MADAPTQIAAYYVTGVGETSGELLGDLQEALKRADEINRATAGTTPALYGRAFVIPVMAITYPAALAPTAPSTGSVGRGPGVDIGIRL